MQDKMMKARIVIYPLALVFYYLCRLFDRRGKFYALE
jgi:hypothetical protein